MQKTQEKDDDTSSDDDDQAKTLTFDTDSSLHPVTPPINQFLPQEDPELSLFSTITVYGKRKTGKSVFIKWYLQWFKHLFPWFWVFTLTKFNSHYSSFIPDKFILGEFSADAMSRIMDRQEMAIRTWLDNPQNTDFNPRAGIIWDDYMGNDIRFNGILHQYYFTGRHFQTINFFAAQHITMTPPSIRSNTDLPVLFSTDYKDSMDHYYRDFAGRLDRKVFEAMYKHATSPQHGFMAINNDPNVPLDKKFYMGKAEYLPAKIEYIVGCREYWHKSEKQLEKIASGKMQENLDRYSKNAEWVLPKEMPHVQKLSLVDPNNKIFPNKNTLMATNKKLPTIEDNSK